MLRIRFVLAIVLLSFSALVLVGNFGCLWLTFRTGRNHSLIPILGAAFGSAGLAVLPSPLRPWIYVAPLLLDGSAIILITALAIDFWQRGCVLINDMRKRQQRGVTLIEMMVVVTVIALFSGIVGVKYYQHVEKSKHVAAKSQLSGFTAGIAAFYADVNRYPTADEGLKALRQAPPAAAQLWRGPYLTDELPNDPWGRPYLYEMTASGEPRVICLGADGAPGGDGVNADVFSWK